MKKITVIAIGGGIVGILALFHSTVFGSSATIDPNEMATIQPIVASIQSKGTLVNRIDSQGRYEIGYKIDHGTWFEEHTYLGATSQEAVNNYNADQK